MKNNLIKKKDYLPLKKSMKTAGIFLQIVAKNKVVGINSPVWMHLFVTRRCNLRCEYCDEYDNSKKDPSLEKVKEMLDSAWRLGIRGVAFMGGEPTIRNDFDSVLEYAVKKGYFTYFTTNGFLLNKNKIEKYSLTGVNFIEISVDSINSFAKSKKDFNRLENILKILNEAKRKYGFGLKTHMVLTSENIDTAIDTIKKVDSFGMSQTVGLVGQGYEKNGRAKVPKKFFFKSGESIQKLKKVTQEICKLKRIGVKVMDPVSYFENADKLVQGQKWKCRAGEYSINIDIDGSLTACHNVEGFEGKNIFNIKKGDLKKSVKKIIKLKRDGKRCIDCHSTAHYTTADYIDHPIGAFLGRR